MATRIITRITTPMVKEVTQTKKTNNYPNDQNNYTYKSNRGNSRNHRNVQQDHERRTQQGNSRQNSFLGNQRPQTDLGLIVTDLISAVERMNTPMERLEKGKMNKMPPTVTLVHQKYRHVDHLEYMNRQEVRCHLLCPFPNKLFCVSLP